MASAADAGGVISISRWLSEATPPVTITDGTVHPERMPACRRCLRATTPAGVVAAPGPSGGVVAAQLHPRLMAAIALRWDCKKLSYAPPLRRRTPRRYRGSLAGLGAAALISWIAANFTKLL